MTPNFLYYSYNAKFFNQYVHISRSYTTFNRCIRWSRKANSAHNRIIQDDAIWSNNAMEFNYYNLQWREMNIFMYCLFRIWCGFGKKSHDHWRILARIYSSSRFALYCYKFYEFLYVQHIIFHFLFYDFIRYITCYIVKLSKCYIDMDNRVIITRHSSNLPLLGLWIKSCV